MAKKLEIPNDLIELFNGDIDEIYRLINVVYYGMVSRCYKENNPAYKNYGGRGIIVCNEWLNDRFQFCYDVGPRDNDTFSIDRIDNDGNYEPKNVRWATRKQQQNNMRSNRNIEYNGRTLTLNQWIEESNLKRSTVFYRLNHGYSIGVSLGFEDIETVHSSNPLSVKRYEYNGHEYTIQELSSLSGINQEAIRTRINTGWSITNTVERPLRVRTPKTLIEYEGQYRTISQLAELSGLSKSTLYNRLKAGWDIEKALRTPSQRS